MSRRKILNGWTISAAILAGTFLHDKLSSPDNDGPAKPIFQNYDTLHNQPSVHPISMGGYEERHTAHASDSLLSREQVQYLANKADLIVALQACADQKSSCDPKIRPWLERVEQLRHIPDKMKRLKTLNSVANSNIRYAYDMAADDVPMASLMQTATNGQGRCGEIALFKMALAELTGFDPQDIRYVWVGYFQNGQLTYNSKTHSVITHAVFETRVNGTNWVLDDNTSSRPDGAIDNVEANKLAIDTSRMEPDTVKLGVTGASFIWGKTVRLQPIAEFNSSEIADYAVPVKSWQELDRNPPLAALYARAETIDLTDEFDQRTAENLFVRQTVTAALSERYTIKKTTAVVDGGTGDRAVCDECDDAPKLRHTLNDKRPEKQTASANDGDDYMAHYERNLEKIAAANGKSFSRYYGHPRP